MYKIILALILGAIIGLSITFLTDSFDNKPYTIKNNSTRDYKYEHYCDSIYEVNPDYYLDVLVETDEFQNYIDEHGEWWTN